MSELSSVDAWMGEVKRAIAEAGGSGAFLVSLGAYRPDLVRALANALGYAFVDFRARHMAPLGPGAAGVTLERINEVAADAAGRAGIVLHNVEGLLATRSAETRRAFLADLVGRTSEHAVVVPLAIFCDEAPEAGPRHVRLDPAALPDEKLLMRLATR